MTSNQNIGLFYSYGPHFLRTARALRKDYGKAHITAFVPRGFPAELLSSMDIQCVPILPKPSEKRSIRDVATIVKTIRSARPEIFVVLFDSPKLRALAALSTAKTKYCYHVDNRISTVRWGLSGNLLQTFGRGIRGRIRFARIWCHVYFTRINRGNSKGNANLNEDSQDLGLNTEE